MAFADSFKLVRDFTHYTDPEFLPRSRKLQKELLETGELYFVDTKRSHGALLVIEKGYLNAREIRQIAGDVAEALDKVPRLVGRPFVTKKRITVYIYKNGKEYDRPISFTWKIGAVKGTWGIMLSWVKEGKAPTFHEFAHLAERVFDSKASDSLSEGLAEYVHAAVRKGEAHGFTPENANPDKLALQAIKRRPNYGFLDKIGVPGADIRWPQPALPEIRFDFYFASWSFVKFLVAHGGMHQLVRLLDAGGTPKAYQRLYHRNFIDLRQAWQRRLLRLKDVR